MDALRNSVTFKQAMPCLCITSSPHMPWPWLGHPRLITCVVSAVRGKPRLSMASEQNRSTQFIMTSILPPNVLDFIVLKKEFGPKRMDLCGRHPSGQPVHEKMLNIPNQRESAGHNEMSLTQLGLSVIKKTRRQASAGTRTPSCPVAGDAPGCSRCGKQDGGSSEHSAWNYHVTQQPLFCVSLPGKWNQKTEGRSAPTCPLLTVTVCPMNNDVNNVFICDQMF